MLRDGAQEGSVRSTGSFKGRRLVSNDFDVAGERGHAATIFHVLPDCIAACKWLVGSPWKGNAE
eukprot:6574721-Alexandrium_andersonii.AAC.1